MAYTRKQLTMAHSTLKTLIEQATKNQVECPTVGICFNWGRMLSGPSFWGIRAYYLVTKLSPRWPYTTGDAVCPILDNNEFSKWSGHNLAMRLSLMRYMLKRLRDMKRRAKA